MRIHHHALLTVAATLALMVMGSLVHGTGSSLACPDWPLCHGAFLPTMTNGVEFEHTHRLMAAGVVLLAATLLVRTLRRTDGRARVLAATACGLILVQATLGALTVLYRLPPAISIAHLATSMTFLACLVLLAVRLAPHGLREAPGTVRAWAGSVALLVLAQIVLGGVVRHTGAALACSGVPLCTGIVWPDWALGQIHMLHRAVGVLAFAGAVAASVVAWRAARTRMRRALAIAPGVVAIAQVTLGVAVVLAAAPLDLVTLHHAGGALLLASLTSLASGRLS
jgi:heme A synthase